MRKKPMLAYPANAKPIDYSKPTFIQPKLDGVRCLIQYENRPIETDDLSGQLTENVVIAYSRTGKEWKNINHILEQLIPFFQKHPDVILDGELYNHDLRDDFEKIISLVRKTKPTDEDRLESAEMVQFHCYDIINEDWHFEDRNLFRQQNFSYYGDYQCDSVKDVIDKLVCNEELVEVAHEDYLEMGYEGSILRKNEPYECKRSWTLQKVKDFSDAEATLLAWVEGKGKRKGTVGKFIAIDDDGNEFGMPVMDKFKYLQDNFRKMRGWVGKRATFTYFERTKANSYRHPLFKTIRDYE